MASEQTRPETTLFCLHLLGGSGRTWAETAERLPPKLRVVTVDLPGFGDNAHLAPGTVSGMADHVADAIRAAQASRFVVAGHSMGAKVAAVLARRAEDGEPGLGGLAGLVLVAGSPPSPEPMDEARRQEMLSWFEGTEAEHREQGDRFVSAGVGAPLPPALHERTVADVLRAGRDAWRAWLRSGSNEDWSGIVGRLRTPALIVAGSEDADLGPDAQASLVAPHFRTVRLVTLDGAAHLLPLERADALASLIADFAAAEPAAPRAAAAIPPDFLRLLESDRVSARTREVLLARAGPDDPDRSPAALSPPVFEILRAVLDRVLPQDDGTRIDLAARIDASLAAGEGDGWRYAVLPPDREAMRSGLLTLDAAARAGPDGRPFVLLDADRKDALLAACAAGREQAGGRGLLDPPRMTLWFEDLRALAVRFWIPHPATLARLGHGGIAYGGDGPVKPGFARVGLGGCEDWEPVAP